MLNLKGWGPKQNVKWLLQSSIPQIGQDVDKCTRIKTYTFRGFRDVTSGWNFQNEISKYLSCQIPIIHNSLEGKKINLGFLRIFTSNSPRHWINDGDIGVDKTI